MPLPNFFCVGAQKSGTTSLHNILKQHPDIYLPELKETKFFQNDLLFFKGLDFYEKEFFGKWKGEKAIGEIDPDYMYFDYVPERLYKLLGSNIKLIFILRNPVDRAYSNYLMTLRRGYEIHSFEKAINLEPERLKIDNFHKLHFSYIDRGFYSKQIKKFFDFFPREKMFFIIFETDFVQHRERTIKSLLKFLNVSVNVELDINIKSNMASVPRFKLISDFLYNPNPAHKMIKKIGKLFFPTISLRRKIRKTIEDLNQKPYEFPALNVNLKKNLLKKFFMEDIKELEDILSRRLNIWYEL